MNGLDKIDYSFSKVNENKFIDLILYGSDKLDDKKNHNILMFIIKIIKDSQRFRNTTCYNYLTINMKRIYVLFMCIIA